MVDKNALMIKIGDLLRQQTKVIFPFKTQFQLTSYKKGNTDIIRCLETVRDVQP